MPALPSAKVCSPVPVAFSAMARGSKLLAPSRGYSVKASCTLHDQLLRDMSFTLLSVLDVATRCALL